MLAALLTCAELYWGWCVLTRIRFTRNGPVLLCSACLLGKVVSTWLVFVSALVTGVLSTAAVTAVGILLLAHAAVLRPSQEMRVRWRIGWALAAAWFIVVVPFFIFGCWLDAHGNWCVLGNYDDIAYHMAQVSHFAEQHVLSTENPQSATHKLIYHFLVNFHTALLVKGGWSYWFALVFEQTVHATALVALLWYAAVRLLHSRTSAVIAVLCLLLGNIGLANVLVALSGNEIGGMRAPALHLPWADYLNAWCGIITYPYFNYANPIVNLFHPQRPFLIGCPLFLLAVLLARQAWILQKNGQLCLILACSLVGLMPLFHLHSFLILVTVIVLVTITTVRQHHLSIVNCFPLSLAVPQLIFLLHAPKPAGYSGWDVSQLQCFRDLMIANNIVIDRVIYWFRVGGLVAVAGVPALVILVVRTVRYRTTRATLDRLVVIIGTIVALLFVMLINFYRFSPNWGDSNKFFFYYCVFGALSLSAWWGRWWRAWASVRPAIALVLTLTVVLPFAIEYSIVVVQPVVSQVASAISDTSILNALPESMVPPGLRGRLHAYRILFSSADIDVASWIRHNLPADAVIASSDSTVHYAAALTGRRLVNGSYTWETGMRIAGIEERVRAAFVIGDMNSFRELGATYVLVGPHERREYAVDTARWGTPSELDVCSVGERYQLFGVNASMIGSLGGATKTMCPIELMVKSALRDLNDSTRTKERSLTELSPIVVSQQWGELNIDRGLMGGEVQLKGVTCQCAIATHAYSQLRYALYGQYRHFIAVVGIDDSQRGSIGSVIFQIVCDDTPVWRSDVMRADGQVRLVQVDLRNVRQLVLEVSDAGDGIHNDWGVWGHPVLVL